MPPISKERAHARGVVAGLSRDRRPDDPQLVEARRNLAALSIEAHIARVVAEAPPLTEGARRDRLAVLLRDGGGPDAA